MDKVAVYSLFRNNSKDVARTFGERALWNYDRDKVTHICIEGDSTDDTYEKLKKIQGFKTIIKKVDQGTPHYGSYAIPERLEALSRLWNIALEIALDEGAEHLLMLDSDITTPPHILTRLIAHKKDVVSPMFFFEKSVFWRDTWGYHADGVDFLNRYPYHKRYSGRGLFEVDCVGVPFMRRQVAESGVRYGPHEVRSFCAEVRAKGFTIWVDPGMAVYHPRHGQEIPLTHERSDVSAS